MKKSILTILLSLAPSMAFAQCTGVFPSGTICGNPVGAPAIPRPLPLASFSLSPGGTNGQIQYNNAGAFGGFTLSGDCTANTTTGAITCTKTNGSSFGTFATRDAATPPAIGGTTPAAGTFTAGSFTSINNSGTLNTGALTGTSGSFSSLTNTAITGSTQCVQANSSGVLSGSGTTCGAGGGLAAGPFVTSVTLTAGGGGTATGRTYNATPIGAAAGNRTVIVFDSIRANGNCQLTGMTIGGIAATRQAQLINNATFTTSVSIWTAAVPTGTTANIVTTYCANVDSAEALGVYAVYGLTRGMVSSASSTAAINPIMPVTVPAGGYLISGAWAINQSSSVDWVGALADYALLSDPIATQYQFGASGTNSGSTVVVNAAAIYGASCGTDECAALTAAFK